MVHIWTSIYFFYSLHFKICNSDFIAEIRVVRFQNQQLEFLPQNSELCAFQKLATRIFTSKIQVVCISKFATRIFTAKIRVVGVSEFATRILTAKIRVVSISKFATQIFTAKIRVVCASKFATRIFPAKILVVCVSKCATDSNSYRKNLSESYCRKKSVDFRRKFWRSVNFKFATQIFTAKVQRRCNFRIYNLDFYV